MKHFTVLYSLLILAFILLTQNVAADRIKMERVRVAESDLSARTLSVKDLNGNNCALVKMFMIISGVRFQGNIIKIEENNPGEYWVYMTEGSKELRINVPNNMPIDVNFLTTDIGAPLISNMVYEIYFSVEDLSLKMSNSSFNNALAHRNRLIKDGKYGEAIESLTILKDSLRDIGVSHHYIESVDSRINECKRRQVLEKTGFEELGVLSEGMVMIKKVYENESGANCRLIGFMDSVGNIVVEPKYINGLDYNKGVAWVRTKNGRWGCLDKKGAVKIPLEYKMAKPIKYNREINWMKVSLDSIHFGVIDYSTGRQVLPMKYEDPSANESPDDNPLVGLYNPSQKKTNFYNKKDFSLEFSIDNRQKIDRYLAHGLFVTFKKIGMKKNIWGYKSEERVYGIVDIQGRVVLECENWIRQVMDFEKKYQLNNASEDFVMVKCPPRKNWDDLWIPAYRIYSLKDREFIEDELKENLFLDVIGSWKNWIVVNCFWKYTDRRDMYGLVNVKNGTMIYTYYLEPKSVNEGKNLILRTYSGTWCLFNNDGEFIELPENDSGYHYEFFEQGYATLEKDGKEGIVDSKGKIVVKPSYDKAYYDYGSSTWKLRSGDETIPLENLIPLSD